MLTGYPFQGTGAAAPTADNVTFYDPILGKDVTALTIRGDRRDQVIRGISFASDAPGLGSRLELRIGNQITDDRVIDVFPTLDGDLVTQPINTLNYIDLGGIPVVEDETIDIRLYDPGAAELMSGVLWLEDGEPTIPIPSGRIVSLRFGGTNDCGTTLAVTGFDMDSVKLVNERLYTPFCAMVRPEDKVIEALILKAGKDAMTLPPTVKMIYPTAPIQFTGNEYNSGYVVGYAEAQSATKFEAIVYCVESEGVRQATSNAAPVTTSTPTTIPGAVSPANLGGGSISRRPTGRPTGGIFNLKR